MFNLEHNGQSAAEFRKRVWNMFASARGPKKQVDLSVLHAFNLSMFAGGGVLYVAIFDSLVNYLDICIFADPFSFLIQCWQTTIAKGSSKSF